MASWRIRAYLISEQTQIHAVQKDVAKTIVASTIDNKTKV